MKYVWTTMHVSDLDKSVDFYSRVCQLELEGRFPAGPGMEIAFLKSQDTETKIELIGEKTFGGQAKGISLSLGFLTADVEAKRNELEMQGYAPSKMVRPNPQTQFFFVKDPDGIDIQFVEE